jgi:hypothetical protein
MTEQEWLESGDWEALWIYLLHADLQTGRNTLLVVLAPCRRFIHRLRDPRSLHALDICERLADDGENWEEEVRDVYDDALAAAYAEPPGVYCAAACVAGAVCHPEPTNIGRAAHAVPAVYGYEAAIAAGLISEVGSESEVEKIWSHPIFQSGVELGKRILADITREIIGNPFRPVKLNPEWLTWNDGTVRRIAQTIYDERAFDRLPILADALEDAGCDNADILKHCRSGGEHVRGCWVVDLLLGKS